MIKRREWFLITLPFFLTWTLDRITKTFAEGMTQIIDFGFMQFALHHNQGAMLGLFSDLPEVLRIVTLATTGAFLLCAYFLLQYLLPFKSLTLRAGLSFLMGGILGNVTDRIIWGYVVDFITFNFMGRQSPVFNIADALQWIGYGMIIYTVIAQGSTLWPENNQRKHSWVNATFQRKYIFLFISVGLSLGIITSVFSYTYLRVTLEDILGPNTLSINRFLSPFLVTYAVICFVFALLTFAVGRIISHRIAGPLYAFERYIRKVVDDPQNAGEFKLRTGDELRYLEMVAEDIRNELLNHRQALPKDPAAPK